ncbi:MAG: MoaD/ThiS family protein [Gemmatimonadales bacterium]|jgi:sulfur-carrier protein
MAVSVVLPRALLPYSHGSSTLHLDERCASVAEALDVLRRRWPAVLDRVMTEQGEVREHVNIFVGEESIRFADGLDTSLREGDTIMIVAAVSGG